MECLEQLEWPGDVAFSRVHQDLPGQARHFAQVILLGAIAGPDEPGSLYQANAEELLAGGHPQMEGAGVIGMFPREMRKRLAIFAMHPQNVARGSRLSGDVIRAISLAVPYLRSFILRTLGELVTLQ